MTYHLYKQKSPSTQHDILATHPFYACWYNMIQRCTDNEHPSWARYGGRGVTVCENWRDFKNFKLDMFGSWRQGLELERLDNNAGYFKDNCCWATRQQQCRNKESNILTEEAVATMRLLRENGMLIHQIAKQFGISESHCSRTLRGLKWKP